MPQGKLDDTVRPAAANKKLMIHRRRCDGVETGSFAVIIRIENDRNRYGERVNCKGISGEQLTPVSKES